MFKHYNSDTFAIVDGLELESNHHIHSESLLMRTGKVSCCRFYYNMAAPSNLNVSLQASRKEPLWSDLELTVVETTGNDFGACYPDKSSVLEFYHLIAVHHYS